VPYPDDNNEMQKSELSYWRCNRHELRIPQGEDCPRCAREARDESDLSGGEDDY